MWSGFSVNEMLGVHTLQALVLFQVTPHLYMFWIGLEVRVCSSSSLLVILQLERQRRREKNNQQMTLTKTSIQPIGTSSENLADTHGILRKSCWYTSTDRQGLLHHRKHLQHVPLEHQNMDCDLNRRGCWNLRLSSGYIRGAAAGKIWLLHSPTSRPRPPSKLDPALQLRAAGSSSALLNSGPDF